MLGKMTPCHGADKRLIALNCLMAFLAAFILWRMAEIPAGRNSGCVAERSEIYEERIIGLLEMERLNVYPETESARGYRIMKEAE